MNTYDVAIPETDGGPDVAMRVRCIDLVRPLLAVDLQLERPATTPAVRQPAN